MTVAQGTFYALGLGPGDADLMTVRAHTLLQRVKTICAPVRRPGGLSYALQIAGEPSSAASSSTGSHRA